MLFLAFLAIAAGFALYAPDFISGRASAEKNTVQPQAAAVTQEAAQSAGVHSESMDNLKAELGIAADKPLVEETTVLPPAAEKLMHSSEKGAATLDNFRAAASGFYAQVLNYAKYLFSEHGSDMTAAAVIIFVVALVSKCFGFFSLAYLFCRLGWFFSRFSIALLSAASILFFFTAGKNLWQDAGSVSFTAPLAVLAASSAAFRIMDSNFPVWNRLFGSFVMPIISGIIVNAPSVSKIIS